MYLVCFIYFSWLKMYWKWGERKEPAPLRAEVFLDEKLKFLNWQLTDRIDSLLSCQESQVALIFRRYWVFFFNNLFKFGFAEWTIGMYLRFSIVLNLKGGLFLSSLKLQPLSIIFSLKDKNTEALEMLSSQNSKHCSNSNDHNISWSWIFTISSLHTNHLTKHWPLTWACN